MAPCSPVTLRIKQQTVCTSQSLSKRELKKNWCKTSHLRQCLNRFGSTAFIQSVFWACWALQGGSEHTNWIDDQGRRKSYQSSTTICVLTTRLEKWPHYTGQTAKTRAMHHSWWEDENLRSCSATDPSLSREKVHLWCHHSNHNAAAVTESIQVHQNSFHSNRTETQFDGWVTSKWHEQEKKKITWYYCAL